MALQVRHSVHYLSQTAVGLRNQSGWLSVPLSEAYGARSFLKLYTLNHKNVTFADWTKIMQFNTLLF